MKACLKNNQKIVKRALSVILTLFLAFSIVTVWGNITLSVEKFNIETDKIEIENGYKIAHISDYHNTKNTFLNEAVLSSLKAEKPDIIVLTGDLVDCRKTDIQKTFYHIVILNLGTICEQILTDCPSGNIRR
jgi:predicted MPP superfamily phosphohydrolase